MHRRNFLKTSFKDRIFFSGEATSGQWATVYVANRSGERVASGVVFDQKLYS
jgi:hypothetical protein